MSVYCGEAPRSIVDQLSRNPESLARSLAANIRTIHHPKLCIAFDCMLAVGPEHARVFQEAGWSKEQLRDKLSELLQVPGEEVIRGAGGIEEGLPEGLRNATLPKLRPGGLYIVHCGGGAGLFSAIIGGWLAGSNGSQPVVREIQA